MNFSDENNSLFAFWVVCFFAIAATIQFNLPYPIDDDTAYHFSVARLIKENGILHEFPWTRFSWQFDRYADKEFLFHLLFIPFSSLGFENASRVVGALGGGIILTVLFLVMKSEKVSYSGFWALFPLTASVFVYRIAQVRPQLISIALALLFLWGYGRRKLILIGVVSLLYPLSYVAFWQIPLILIAATETARFFYGSRFDWKPALVTFLGISIGLILHPNAANLLSMNWIHMSDVLFRNAWGNHVEFNLGEEFDPFSIFEWLQFLAVTVAMNVWAAKLSLNKRKEDLLPLAASLAAIVFGLLTCRTSRFVEYFVPFTVLAASFASRFSVRKNLVWIVASVCLLYQFSVGLLPFRIMRSDEIRKWRMTPEVRSLFDREIPQGSTVFTTGWEYSGSLLLNLPGRFYMVALDPTLMHKRDPKLYDAWYRLLLDAPPNAAEIIREKFSSRYVVAQNYEPLWPFFDSVAKGAGVRAVYADDNWLLFDLGAAASAGR